MMRYEKVKKIVSKIKDNLKETMKKDVSIDNLDNFLSDVRDSGCEDCYRNKLDVISDIILYISHL